MSRGYGSNRASVTDSPAFRRWFGDSVVVDEDGEPLVVYHGTDDDDFKSFQAEALPRGGRKGRLLGEGFYFTSDPDQAARWGRHVIAAYLRIENPRTQRDGLLVPASSDQDGTIAAGAPGTRDGEVWFVVKSPYQIKSATDNDGSFDPDDDRFTSNGRTFIPPQKVADEAAYGLYLRSQMPKSNRCCTAVGLRRASQLSNREPVSVTTLERMRSYFQRHEVDKRGTGWGVDSKGYQAWLLWGGDSGRAWANKMLREVGRARANSAGDAVFRQDIPNARWVADKLEEAEEGGRNRWGVPRRMGPITGSFSRPLRLPTELLATLRGERGEQDNPRPESLQYIADHWERLKDKAVYIEVDPFGQPWVSEGNHRIMVASALGEPSVLAEVRFFSGGQLKAKAKWKPKQLLEYDANADAREGE